MTWVMQDTYCDLFYEPKERLNIGETVSGERLSKAFGAVKKRERYI